MSATPEGFRGDSSRLQVCDNSLALLIHNAKAKNVNPHNMQDGGRASLTPY